MKRLLALCIPALILGLLWNYIFNYHISHSLLFWERCAKVSDKWAENLRKDNSPCYVFVGGSETRTTIDPEQLLQLYGIRAITSAGPIGFSFPCNFEATTKYLKKGDTLVVSFPVATFNAKPSKAGLKFLWKRMGVHMFDDGIIRPNYSNIRSLIMGDGGIFSFTLIKAAFTKGPVYSYTRDSRIHRSGWMEVTRSRPIKLKPSYPPRAPIPHLTQVEVAQLRHLSEACKQRGVNLLFRRHLEYRGEEDRAVQALCILDLVRAGYKVLKEERLGCETAPSHFSDTFNHLSAYGTQVYMQELGKAIKNHAYWTEEELIEKLREYGRDAEGNPL